MLAPGQPSQESPCPHRAPSEGREASDVSVVPSCRLLWWLHDWVIFHEDITYVLALQGEKKEDAIPLLLTPQRPGFVL